MVAPTLSGFLPVNSRLPNMLVSKSDTQLANGPSFGSALSETGQFVVLVTKAKNLTTGVQNDLQQIYLFDRDQSSYRRISEMAVCRAMATASHRL